MTEGLDVIYIAGYGRSGSTLLDWILGQAGTGYSLGETVHLWHRGCLEDQLCQCGRAFSNCPFWSEVTARLPVTAEDVLRLRAACARMRHMPLLLGYVPQPEAYRRSLSEYRGALLALYESIQAVSGADLLIDSSKDPVHAAVLCGMPIQLHVVHLIRDARAVAFSWARRKVRPETRNSELMPRYGTLKSSFEWVLWNGLAELVGRRAATYLTVRYEDFMNDPATVVRRIFANAGVRLPTQLASLAERTFMPHSESHMVAGNPVRFSSGPLQLIRDDEWRIKMPWSARALATCLTLPGLIRFGYGLSHRAKVRASAR